MIVCEIVEVEEVGIRGHLGVERTCDVWWTDWVRPVFSILFLFYFFGILPQQKWMFCRMYGLNLSLWMIPIAKKLFCAVLLNLTKACLMWEEVPNISAPVLTAGCKGQMLSHMPGGSLQRGPCTYLSKQCENIVL